MKLDKLFVLTPLMMLPLFGCNKVKLEKIEATCDKAFYVGETINKKDIKLIATYVDKTSKEVTDFTSEILKSGSYVFQDTDIGRKEIDIKYNNMTTSIKVLVDGKNKVCEESWNEAVECITNVNKTNKLNYTATCDIEARQIGVSESFKYTSLKVDDKIQEITMQNTEEGKQPETKIIKVVLDGPFRIDVSEDVKPGEFSPFSANDLFDFFFDLYDHQKNFTYDESKKVYTCVETYEEAYSSFNAQLSFKDRRIDKIALDYIVLGMFSFKGSVTFDYGNTTLSLTEAQKAKLNNAWNEIKKDQNQIEFTIEDVGTVAYKHNFFKIHTSENETRNEFKMTQEYGGTHNLEILHETGHFSLLYFNDTFLIEGESENDDCDYYFKDNSTILVFKNPKSLSNGLIRMGLCTGSTTMGEKVTVHFDTVTK